MTGICSGVGDGSRAHAGFIGKHTPGYADSQRKEHGTHGAAGEGGGGEKLLQKWLSARRGWLRVLEQRAEAQGNIPQGHDGNQIFRHCADPLGSTQNDQSYNGSGNQSHGQISIERRGQPHETKRFVDAGHGCTDLRGIAYAKSRYHTEGAKQSAQPGPFGPQTVFDVVHGTAPVTALCIRFPVTDSQNYFGEFDYHAKQGGDPHPENGAGTADCDGSGYACDVSVPTVAANAVHTA